ncbi:MAG: VanZ family protein [Candidatus Cloacimonetes bacterium]|nr:VanZ family protein [Candidatus Cloacimonadota bacterium]
MIWTIIIAVLTSYPKLQSPTSQIINYDKIAHFMMYFIFSILFMKMHNPSDMKKTIKKLYFLMMFVPLFDEIHQIPIPGREFSVYDILADLLGFAVIILFYRMRKRGMKE